MIDGVEKNEREGGWKREVKERISLKRPDGREERLLEERVRRRMKRGMDGNEECVERRKFGKTRKHTR